jgi:hypothetical protein
VKRRGCCLLVGAENEGGLTRAPSPDVEGTMSPLPR